MMKQLKNSRSWVFDLDNTLYPTDSDLFAQIDKRITRYVSEFFSIDPVAAKALQKQFYLNSGTTLNGLMENHTVQADDYLEFVHDIEYSVLQPDLELAAAIDALPGKKHIFTNGSAVHAKNVLNALGLDGLFDGIIDIKATGYVPKPDRLAYDHLINALDLEPKRSVFFEDLARNLLPAYKVGFTTVLVCSDKDWSHEPKGARPASIDDKYEHVNFSTDDLTGFLKNTAI
ncbi:pyrimidine 5'-nucleotidase [Oceanicaulis sp. AH-315-P02]|nr:pyrimidine 5'-nucleotidase [Oceanicaulis sp. AH-315-P02]